MNFIDFWDWKIYFQIWSLQMCFLEKFNIAFWKQFSIRFGQTRADRREKY